MTRSGRSGQPQKPGGIEALAQQHADAAIATLVEICGNRDAPPAARVAAATALLDRGWGKARQPLEHSGEVAHKYVVRMPTPSASADEWLARHAPKGMEQA